MQRIVTRGLGSDQLLATRGYGRRTVVLQIAIDQPFRRRRNGGGRRRREEREEREQSLTVNASMSTKDNVPNMHKEGISTVSFKKNEALNVSSKHVSKKKINPIEINASVQIKEKKTEIPIVINASLQPIIHEKTINEITASATFAKKKLIKDSICSSVVKTEDTIKVQASFVSKKIN